MSHQRLDYAAMIHEHGFRVTPQRRLILDSVCDGGGHTTPEEIYQRVRAKAPLVNRATVYRTLDFLCEMRLIVAMRWGGRTYYEIAGETPHHHLICRSCDRVEQIDHPTLKALFHRIERDQNFTIDMDHVVLFGLCQDCRKASRSKH